MKNLTPLTFFVKRMYPDPPRPWYMPSFAWRWLCERRYRKHCANVKWFEDQTLIKWVEDKMSELQGSKKLSQDDEKIP